MTANLQGMTAVLMPGTGSDDDYVRRAFGGALLEAGAVVVAPRPLPGGLIDGYLEALDAAAQHARLEAQVGGYVAAEAAEPVLEAGRAAVATLTGMAAADVVFTTGSANALNLLLSSWDGDKTIACLPGEYGPNLVVMEANGFTVRELPVDEQGRLDVEVAVALLQSDPPALAHLTALGSHRGVAQPLSEFVQACHAIGVPVAVDAAQALGHLDCAVSPDVIYASSRKWLAGPRGVGVLAISSSVSHRLRPRIPLPEWGTPLPVLKRLDLGEANVAARVAFSTALEEHLVAGPELVRARLADVGRLTRTALATLPGWRWFAWLRLAPRWLRDPPYDMIARNRYRWFGKKTACALADRALRERLVRDLGELG